MNIQPLIQFKYPEGSVGGQCGVFAHQLVDFPSVGDSYKQKKEAVKKFGILKENLAEFQVGDVIISDEGTVMGLGNGHVCVVLDPSNRAVVESNFRNDQKVHFGRKIDFKHVYGVIRGNFKLFTPSPVTVKATIFMQYQKQWKSDIFQQLTDRIFTLTGGMVKLDIYPLYTYYALKDWYYRVYFQNYKVIDKGYIDQQVSPLVYPESQFVLWAINKDQWTGSLINQPGAEEIGWFYPGSKYATIVCEEGEQSFYNFGQVAFLDYAEHEFTHFLYNFGRADQVDLCHQRYFDREMTKVKDDIDFKRFILNI